MRGYCDESEFDRALSLVDLPTLVLMDIEGGEDALLRRDRLPALMLSHILLETHDFVVPGVAARIKRDFSTTHRVEQVFPEERTALDLPPRWRGLFQKWLVHVGADQRLHPELQSFIFLTPRSQSQPHESAA